MNISSQNVYFFFFATSDTIDILYLVYSNFCTKKIFQICKIVNVRLQTLNTTFFVRNSKKISIQYNKYQSIRNKKKKRMESDKKYFFASSLLNLQLQIKCRARTTISQDVQTRFPVHLAFAKFLSKIKGNFLIQCQYHGYSTPSEISLYFR